METGASKQSAPDDEDPTRWEVLAAWLRRPLGIASAILVILLVICAAEGRRGYAAIKVWRSESLLARSVQAQMRGDDSAAQELLRKAGALLAGHPIMLRAVAQYHARRHEPNCLDMYEFMAKRGYATAEDWLEYTRQAFYLALPQKARRGWEELQKFPELADTAPLLRLHAERSAVEGKWTDAIFLAGWAVDRLKGGPGDDERLFLGRLFLRVPDAAVPDKARLAGEGLETLGGLVSRPDPVGRDALAALVDTAKGPGRRFLLHNPNTASWVRSAQANPWVDETLRVQSWELRLAAEPEKREEIIAEFCNQYQNASTTHKLGAARWLQEHREYALVRQISEPAKLESEDWYLVYLDAIAGLGDWEQVLSEMNSDTAIPLAPSVRRLFRLRAELETNRHPDAGQEWDLILGTLGKADLKEKMYVAGYAEQIGFPEQAAAIYEQILKGRMPATISQSNIPNPKKIACYMGLLRTKGATASLQDLVKLMERFAAEYKELDEVQSDAAYFRLLLGDDEEEVRDTVNRLLTARPDFLAYRTSAALLALREKHPDKAYEVYDHWQIPWNEAADRFKAVRVAVLEANGREEEAVQLRSTIQADRLRPEERDLAGIQTAVNE